VDTQGRASLWAAGAVLGGPNGLLLDYGNVGWVTFFGGQVKRVTRTGKIITEGIRMRLVNLLITHNFR
jgi:hypothetical protein